MPTLKPVCLLTILLLTAPAQAALAQNFREPARAGPFTVRVHRVIEGDHFDLGIRKIRRAPASDIRTRFRLANVNTPSPHADKDCEREFGVEVRDYVRQYVRGVRVRARDVRRGRNSFERVGRLEVNGLDLGELLLEKGMAVPYNDSTRNPQRRSWECVDE